MNVSYRWLRVGIATMTLLMGPLVPKAFSQSPPAPAVDVSGGWVGFPDDGVVNETWVGGALRWYVSPRIAIGPEVGVITGTNHNHIVLTGNLTWDVAQLAGGRVTPFVVVGGGLFQTRQRFTRETVTSREGAFTAGGGVRVRASDRITLGVDTRIGWETHVRIAGVVGVNLGR